MKKTNISQVDAVFANGSYPVEFLFFYKGGLPSANVRSALDKLSAVFWPLFGEYRAGIIHFDPYSEEDCLAETVRDQEFDAAETHGRIYEKYRGVNPPEMKKLYFLTIVHCKNGDILIPKMNHLAGDGYSYFYFLSALAETCRRDAVPSEKDSNRPLPDPHHDRTILKDFIFRKNDLKPAPVEDHFLIEFQKFPRREVRDAIKAVALKWNQQVSANDILSAMAVKKSVAIQKGHWGENFQLTIPIDVRGQIKEYGLRYFGNGILFKTINFETENIENDSAETIAIEIRKSMPSVTRENYVDYLEQLEALIVEDRMDALRPYDPETGCLVTNLSRLPADQLDFGTGCPDLIFPLTIEKNSIAVLADKENYILRYARSYTV